MRNFLDTASIAQSLDGARLTGSLHIPTASVIPERSVHKDVNVQRGVIIGGPAPETVCCILSVFGWGMRGKASYHGIPKCLRLAPLFLPAGFHAHLVFGLARRPGVIFHAGSLLIAAYLAA